MRIKCPKCGGPSTLDRDNTWRPFCSERCRLLDLGAWLEGDYAIPGERAEEDDLRREEDDLGR